MLTAIAVLFSTKLATYFGEVFHYISAFSLAADLGGAIGLMPEAFALFVIQQWLRKADAL
jgi:hypothetical protein